MHQLFIDFRLHPSMRVKLKHIALASSIKKPLSIAEGNTDIAAGVMTQTSSIMVERALTVEQFKSRIADLLAN